MPFPHCLCLERRGGKNLGNQGLLGNSGASRPRWLLLSAPTRTQRLQVSFWVGGPGRWAHGAPSGAAGTPAAHHPLPALYQFRREPPAVCQHPPLPPSQTISARLTAPCPDYAQQACRSPGWAPALQEERLLGRLSGGSGGWALALRTDSASWDRGPGSPLKLGRKPALDWASEGPGHTTE